MNSFGLIMEKWRRFANESLLREYTRKDEAELMEIEDQFTISYEVELLSNNDMNEYVDPGPRFAE